MKRQYIERYNYELAVMIGLISAVGMSTLNAIASYSILHDKSSNSGMLLRNIEALPLLVVSVFLIMIFVVLIIANKKRVYIQVEE